MLKEHAWEQRDERVRASSREEMASGLMQAATGSAQGQDLGVPLKCSYEI